MRRIALALLAATLTLTAAPAQAETHGPVSNSVECSPTYTGKSEGKRPVLEIDVEAYKTRYSQYPEYVLSLYAYGARKNDRIQLRVKREGQAPVTLQAWKVGKRTNWLRSATVQDQAGFEKAFLVLTRPTGEGCTLTYRTQRYLLGQS